MIKFLIEKWVENGQAFFCGLIALSMLGTFIWYMFKLFVVLFRGWPKDFKDIDDEL